MTTDNPLDRTHLFIDSAPELLIPPASGSPRLAWTVGVGENGDFVRMDLRGDLPHLLVTGTERAGRSELIESMICQLAHNSTPADLELWLVSCRELVTWAGVPHVKRVLDLRTTYDFEVDAAVLMDEVRQEMTRRYLTMLKHPACVSDIAGARAVAHSEGGRPGQRHPLDFPYIVVVIEDVARILSRPTHRTCQAYWSRLVVAVEGLALARGAGISLVMATPRASDAAFGGAPAIKQQCQRIGLAAATAMDSLFAIDQRGLEALNVPGSGMAVAEGEYRPFRSFHLRWPSEERPHDPDDRADLLARLVA